QHVYQYALEKSRCRGHHHRRRRTGPRTRRRPLHDVPHYPRSRRLLTGDAAAHPWARGVKLSRRQTSFNHRPVRRRRRSAWRTPLTHAIAAPEILIPVTPPQIGLAQIRLAQPMRTARTPAIGTPAMIHRNPAPTMVAKFSTIAI